jgi:hypothetical protein
MFLKKRFFNLIYQILWNSVCVSPIHKEAVPELLLVLSAVNIHLVFWKEPPLLLSINLPFFPLYANSKLFNHAVNSVPVSFEE